MNIPVCHGAITLTSANRVKCNNYFEVVNLKNIASGDHFIACKEFKTAPKLYCTYGFQDIVFDDSFGNKYAILALNSPKTIDKFIKTDSVEMVYFTSEGRFKMQDLTIAEHSIVLVGAVSMLLLAWGFRILRKMFTKSD